jgi:5-oxoprolinase (ATP-hydrolysing)
VDPVRLELYTHRFSALAGEMGSMLERTAVSTNVKERLDFSCALLGPAGELVVNAPHIPVHLGALGLCVRRLRDAVEMEPGDVVVTNHPAYGGSHLPDVTVVTPVFDAGGALLGFAASRAHHAEIGGTRPGSMPPDATCLAEEGVVLPPTKLVAAGEPRWDDVRRRLTAAPYPSRAVEENLADLGAAVAANHRGAEGLVALAERDGRDVVAAAMAAVTGRAESLLRRALAGLRERWGDRVLGAESRLDDGAPLRVEIRLTGNGADAGARIDFTGTAPVHPGNLNAPPAVVASAVLYVLRLLVAEPLPLNEGLLRPVELVVPAASLLDPPFDADPARCPAVVGGNVETSQRLVELLISAFGLAAASQGTMNNVLFGDERLAYYETVCGGTGAGPGFAGASAVHSHMTNTRITDPEVLEHRYPVRLERFAVRRGSGGAGRWRGGDGAVRELTFLAPLSLSVLSQHRDEGPPGAAGGGAGAPGRQRVLRADGGVVELAAVDGCDVAPGDRLLLETPGGGGWGAADNDTAAESGGLGS